MSEHENKPREDEGLEREETVDDLDVPEEQGGDVSGGLKRGVDDGAKK